MAGWRHRLKGHESEQTLGDGEGQGSLARFQGSLAVHGVSPWGHKVRHDLAAEQQASNH